MEEEYEAALAAYQQAYNEALALAIEAAKNAASEAAAEAATQAVAELQQVDEAEMEAYQAEFLNQWNAFYQEYTDAANQLLEKKGIFLWCSDKDQSILEEIMLEILEEQFPGGVEVEGQYTGYDEIYNEAFSEAYAAALDELISNIEIDLNLDNFLEEFLIDPDSDDEWDNWDLLHHYNTGEGEAVRLEDIGLEDEIRNSDSYQTLLSNLNIQIEGKVLEKINDQNLGNNETGSISYSTENTYDFEGAVFAIGGATIRTQSEIEFVIDNEGIVHWKGAAAIHFEDVFEDPLDLGNWVEGSYDIGNPFGISGDWTEQLNGEVNVGN